MSASILFIWTELRIINILCAIVPNVPNRFIRFTLVKSRITHPSAVTFPFIHRESNRNRGVHIHRVLKVRRLVRCISSSVGRSKWFWSHPLIEFRPWEQKSFPSELFHRSKRRSIVRENLFKIAFQSKNLECESIQPIFTRVWLTSKSKMSVNDNSDSSLWLWIPSKLEVERAPDSERFFLQRI